MVDVRSMVVSRWFCVVGGSVMVVVKGVGGFERECVCQGGR